MSTMEFYVLFVIVGFAFFLIMDNPFRKKTTSDLQKSRHLQKSRVTERHNRGTKRTLKSPVVEWCRLQVGHESFMTRKNNGLFTHSNATCCKMGGEKRDAEQTSSQRGAL